MHRGWVLLTAAGLGLAACAMPPSPSRLDYVAPPETPAPARTAVISRPPALVWGNLVDLLQQQGLEITHLDEKKGEIVARYSGAAEPFVNCGWIIAYPGDGLERVPAAVGSATFQRGSRNDRILVQRDLRLDGRMVVRVEPQGGDTVVSTDAVYVLTKVVDPGNSGRRLREVISFETGQSATFTKGTLCRPTGDFEQLVLDSLPATSLVRRPQRNGPAVAARDEAGRAVLVESLAPIEPAAGPPSVDAVDTGLETVLADFLCAHVEPEFGAAGSLRLTGYVASEEDRELLLDSLPWIEGIDRIQIDVDVHPWPYCAILQILAPYRGANGSDLGFKVDLAGGGDLLREGEELSLALVLPQGSRYLHVGHVQEDGTIDHVATISASELASTQGRLEYGTGFEAGAPFGREMVFAIASGRPLFDPSRSEYGPVEEYLSALREELTELEASDPDQPIAADHLFITTVPSGGAS